MTSHDRTRGEYVSVGPRDYLDRFLHEFGLTADDVRGRITSRPTIGTGGAAGEDEWLVHESLLRSHGEFPCAGDAEALEFCREIVNEMVTELGLSHADAVARVNEQWSEPGADGRAPRVWIVGLDIAYHEDAAYWARHMSSDS